MQTFIKIWACAFILLLSALPAFAQIAQTPEQHCQQAGFQATDGCEIMDVTEGHNEYNQSVMYYKMCYQGHYAIVPLTASAGLPIAVGNGTEGQCAQIVAASQQGNQSVQQAGLNYDAYAAQLKQQALNQQNDNNRANAAETNGNAIFNACRMDEATWNSLQGNTPANGRNSTFVPSTWEAKYASNFSPYTIAQWDGGCGGQAVGDLYKNQMLGVEQQIQGITGSYDTQLIAEAESRINQGMDPSEAVQRAQYEFQCRSGAIQCQ